MTFFNGNVSWYIENPVNRFVASKYEYNWSFGVSSADDINISVTGCWRTCVRISLVHSQYVHFVFGGTAARRATVDSLGLLTVILWFGEGCIIIQNDFTSICIGYKIRTLLMMLQQQRSWLSRYERLRFGI